MSSVLKKGLGLYSLVMFVVGLVAWCGRPVRKVPEERYALYYGRQDGVGRLGKDIIMAENIRCSMLFRAKEQAHQFKCLNLFLIVEKIHANHF